MAGGRQVKMETVQTGGRRQEMVTAGGQEMAQMGDARAGGSQLAGLYRVAKNVETVLLKMWLLG